VDRAVIPLLVRLSPLVAVVVKHNTRLLDLVDLVEVVNRLVLVVEVELLVKVMTVVTV
jgi:hypothetical protein